MATKICFYPEKNWKGEKPNFTVSLTLLVSVPPRTATGLSLVQLLLEPNAFPPTYSQLHRNLEEWTLAVRLPHSVFCCVCCVAICILYDDGFLSLGLAFQRDIHRTMEWNQGQCYEKCQVRASTYSSRNHGLFSVIKFLGLKAKAFCHKVFPFRKQKTRCMGMGWAVVFPSRRGKNEGILL